MRYGRIFRGDKVRTVRGWMTHRWNLGLLSRWCTHKSMEQWVRSCTTIPQTMHRSGSLLTRPITRHGSCLRAGHSEVQRTRRTVIPWHQSIHPRVREYPKDNMERSRTVWWFRLHGSNECGGCPVHTENTGATHCIRRSSRFLTVRRETRTDRFWKRWSLVHRQMQGEEVESRWRGALPNTTYRYGGAMVNSA